MPNIVLLEVTKKEVKYPVYIKEQAGVDLSNYPVLIELNENNFLSWDVLKSDGSNLLPVDEYNNPLPYWFEKLDLTNKKALLWVKIPSLGAYKSKYIYLKILSTNPYLDYLDPTKVFILYDDFLWVYSGSGVSGSKKIDLGNGWYLYLYDGGSGAGDVNWSASIGDSVATLTSKDGTADGGAEIVSLNYPLTQKTNMAIKFRAKYPNWGGTGASSYYRAYESGFRNDSINGGTGNVRADYMLNENGRRICSKNSAGSSCTSDLNVLDAPTIQSWVVYELRLIPTKIELFYDVGAGLTYWGEKTDYVPSDTPEIVTFSVASWGGRGPFEIDIDWVFVRPYVEPEPSVKVLEPIAVFKGTYDLY